ncbi:MAG: TM0106 family RecB-like putative nuclease [Solirubrobacterales bacterium]
MQHLDDHLLLSASDLINHLECEHLTVLDLDAAHGRLTAEPKRPDTAELVAGKGDEHELRHLAEMRAVHGDALVEIETGPQHADLVRAAEETEAAMRAGAPTIFQATFLKDGWRGHADFLGRVDRPSAFGDWSYEVADTKLARSVKPYFVIQLCLYSEFVASIQGVEPSVMHVILGTGERRSLALADFAAYYRRMKRHFVERLGSGLGDTYPLPVSHCGLCRWSDVCDARREADDHLSLVARLARPQTVKLETDGIQTVAALAAAGPDDRPKGIGEQTFERLRQQARLQVAQRESGTPSYELLLPELDADCPRRGLALLPKPSEGDIFFDIEGDPFYEDGLEYLWGVTYLEDGQPTFRAFWGRSRAEERVAFEAFIDFVLERRERYPDLHVYHYAPYEPTAMKRMMGLHATREDEVDDLLREHVLVDLYRVVEQSLRISQPSYSIKKVEAFYMEPREESVTDGEDSILMFEQWLDNGDQRLLDAIEQYNHVDCDSTLKLRDWLLERRAECEAEYGVKIPWRPAGADRQTPETESADDETLELAGALIEDLPDESEITDLDERSRWLLAQLLDYHRREDKPMWWEYFSRLEKTPEQLTEEDTEAMGGLAPVGDPEPLPPPKRSTRYRLEFPVQEHKITPGNYFDPLSAQTDAETGEILPFSVRGYIVEQVLDDEGVIEVVRGNGKSAEPLPVALIPRNHYGAELQQQALRELATDVLERGLDAWGRLSCARSILMRELPRSRALVDGEDLQTGAHDLDRTTDIAIALEGSHLFVQGPPGSGKTYTGAQLILSLIAAGMRVGVSAHSHKAIHNLLHEVEKWSDDRGVAFRGLQKHSGGDSVFESELAEPLIEASGSNAGFPTPDGVELMAGTAWLWCREEMRESVDYLVIDEAGQVSLADALALSSAARNVILLGDPLQLAQVSTGSHPPGAGSSVLEHLLGNYATIPADRGVFLDQTRRMHPDVCRFVSEAIYDGRLDSIEECANQDISAAGELTGTGVHSIALDHEGNTRQSPEESQRITSEIAGLIGGCYTHSDLSETELGQRDVIVVSPYNAQVRCLREHLDAAGLTNVEVGTVDKFQGQEAAIAFFSMATSSGQDVPRNVEFLYSRNRLNVAVSRARCIAVLVANPQLMTIRCRTVEQMRLVNALCLLDEMAPALSH